MFHISITIGQKHVYTLQEDLSAFYCCPHRGVKNKSEILSILQVVDFENHFINNHSSCSAVLLEFDVRLTVHRNSVWIRKTN